MNVWKLAAYNFSYIQAQLQVCKMYLKYKNLFENLVLFKTNFLNFLLRNDPIYCFDLAENGTFSVKVSVCFYFFHVFVL